MGCFDSRYRASMQASVARKRLGREEIFRPTPGICYSFLYVVFGPAGTSEKTPHQWDGVDEEDGAAFLAVALSPLGVLFINCQSPKGN